MSAQLKFAEEIEKIIDYFRKEFNLTHIEAIGVLSFFAHTLSMEVHNIDDEDCGEETTY
ncbi:MAG: hypothetical protein ACXAEN_24935 [Candidatus Thorarchaeota archaeon]